MLSPHDCCLECRPWPVSWLHYPALRSQLRTAQTPRLGAAGYLITAGDRAGGFAFLWPADTAHSCEHSGLSPSGTSTTTGGMLTSTAIAQTTPRGPGTFLLVGDAGRLTIDLPTVAILRQGSAHHADQRLSGQLNPERGVECKAHLLAFCRRDAQCRHEPDSWQRTGVFAVTITYQ